MRGVGKGRRIHPRSCRHLRLGARGQSADRHSAYGSISGCGVAPVGFSPAAQTFGNEMGIREVNLPARERNPLIEVILGIGAVVSVLAFGGVEPWSFAPVQFLIAVLSLVISWRKGF